MVMDERNIDVKIRKKYVHLKRIELNFQIISVCSAEGFALLK